LSAFLLNNSNEKIEKSNEVVLHYVNQLCYIVCDVWLHVRW